MTNSHALKARRATVTAALALSLISCGEEGMGEGDVPGTFTPVPIVNAPPIPAGPNPPLAVTPCNVSPVPEDCSIIRGEVFTLAGPVADSNQDIWIQPATGWGEPYQYWTKHDFLRTDTSGRFVTKPLAPARLTIRSYAGAAQPCATIIRSPSTEVIRIELLPRTTFDAIEAPRPLNATEPSLFGTIYEVTPDGRKPVNGAYMEVGYDYAHPDWWFDGEKSIASAYSSREGRYYFCNLPTDIQIVVMKAGYAMNRIFPGALSAGVPLDIQMWREGT